MSSAGIKGRMRWECIEECWRIKRNWEKIWIVPLRARRGRAALFHDSPVIFTSCVRPCNFARLIKRRCHCPWWKSSGKIEWQTMGLAQPDYGNTMWASTATTTVARCISRFCLAFHACRIHFSHFRSSPSRFVISRLRNNVRCCRCISIRVQRTNRTS